MKVFICWAGKLSKEVASILHQYIPSIIQSLEVFMSQHDIDSGARWNFRLVEELSNTNFGILCLTPENLNKAWLLFEAGALSKNTEGAVCGLLLRGLSPSSIKDPLGQFQHRAFIESEFLALLYDLNKRIDRPLNETVLKDIFQKMWPDIQACYERALSNTEDAEAPPQREQKEILDEILNSVRSFGRQLAAIPASETTGAASLYNEGIALQSHFKFNEAIEAFDKAIGINQRTNALVWYSKGNVFYQMKKYNEALQAYKMSIGLNENNINCWNNMGAALVSLGRNTEADAAFAKAKELDLAKVEEV
jgi:tetratricopeptide (TPR) repeat protein